MAESWTSTDVVVGSGIGGLATAVTAATGAKDVLVVEKSPVIGGSSGLSAGEIWVPGTQLEAKAGIDDSREAGVEYLVDIAGDAYADRDRARRYVDAVAFVADAIDVGWEIIRDVPDYEYPAAAGSRAEGR